MAQAPASSSQKFEKTLTILLISDLHSSLPNIQSVVDYVKSNKLQLDGLWISGDFLSMKVAEYKDKSAVAKAETSLDEMLQLCAQMYPNPIIIPGNHDPMCLFDDKTEKFGCGINIHNRIISVADNLYLAGFGGAPPATRGGKPHWEGFPYETHDAMTAAFNPLAKKIAATDYADGSVILFTHTGPIDSSTAKDWRDPNEAPILAGSHCVQNALLDDKLGRRKIMMNIHGHVHRAYGQAFVGNKRVINPGSLKKGMSEFAILVLGCKKDGSWAVEHVEFRHI